MADGKIKISELSEALQINNDAVFPYAQDNGGTDATFKGTVVQIARKVNEGVDFTNLETSNKKIVGAINQTLNNFAEEYDTTETYNTGDPTLYNGTLYKCKANKTTGTWDSSKWEEAKAVDFGSGGGGGSGGHTILDDSGTSLTQRTNLQFKGAYSEDNSTDDTTEVNVVREMTKAEFDLLSADEKVGFINVTDVTGGEEDKFQPVIYSETEREIGVWVDGKPLYQKTFVLSQGIYLAQYQWVDTGCYLPDAEQIIASDLGAGVSEISGFMDVHTADNYSLYAMNMRNTTVQLSKFTVQYTKSTDTAGSGQWTPQGVPAHHYSETEQIIGTWIDGNTLYERVFDLGSDVSIANDTLSDTTIDASNMDKIIYSVGQHSTGATLYPLMANINNNIIRLQSDRNGSGSSASVRYVILQYTKSST